MKYNMIIKTHINEFYFILEFSRQKQAQSLQYFLEQFDINNYYIYKVTRRFKEISKEDFLKFQFAGYILFHKDKFSNDDINKQIKILYEKIPQGVNFFDKPLPPLNILKKIIIKEPIL